MTDIKIDIGDQPYKFLYTMRNGKRYSVVNIHHMMSTSSCEKKFIDDYYNFCEAIEVRDDGSLDTNNIHRAKSEEDLIVLLTNLNS